MGGIAHTWEVWLIPDRSLWLMGKSDSHDVVVVSSQDGDARPRLPVPNSDGLIVRCGDDPWVFTVEEDSPNVVQICERSMSRAATGEYQATGHTASQGEQAFPLLVVPDFDLVVVSTRTEDRLRGMKADSTNRSCGCQSSSTTCHAIQGHTVVLIVSIHQSTHLVVPQLNCTVVQRGSEQWLPRVWVESATF